MRFAQRSDVLLCGYCCYHATPAFSSFSCSNWLCDVQIRVVSASYQIMICFVRCFIQLTRIGLLLTISLAESCKRLL